MVEPMIVTVVVLTATTGNISLWMQNNEKKICLNINIRVYDDNHNTVDGMI